MTTTVAEHLVVLECAGSMALVGDLLNSIVDAVHHNKKIEWIHVRHEEAAAFAASAEAQLTGHQQPEKYHWVLLRLAVWPDARLYARF